jgi:hypothetical protein
MSMNEKDLVDQIYALYEGDDDLWEVDSEEYLVARRYLNAGIHRWRYYERTDWKELFTRLSDATTGSSVTVADTFKYACPTDFVRPTSYVLVGTKLFRIIRPSKAIIYEADDDTTEWCYFTGSPKEGYSLNINPNYSLSAGTTIDYSYYKTPTELAGQTDVPEMADPYFLVHYVLYRLYKNDSEGYRDEFQNAEARLEQMRVDNMSGIEEQPDEVEWVQEYQEGFGY